ncbi:Ferritin-like metal-binding protein YciE [Filimonas lacunae]|uniref:Ferritin-like metal-binding protein YciE n=1 Tax=Filimonas lacunae TaxID=477680 RepID=A0A173MPW7_9BACT|nr:ferritin-like domain-containing protein [Filimonas lacunae]BAV09517.1 hypothetical protein FLA_5566 [Filimonas lacunae]SIS74530.1 Ferritin-like metal-binding protein YciE [Filimonas lacunae]
MKTTSPSKKPALDNSKLNNFFIDSLQDIYYAEKHLAEALETLEEKATTESLKATFAEHRAVTKGQINRLERVFELMTEQPQTKTCHAIKGIIKEAEAIIKETDSDTITRDAALIMAAQKAEHYEIATYGTLVHLARALEQNKVADLLQETLMEEKAADTALSDIAESFINEMASEEAEENE